MIDKDIKEVLLIITPILSVVGMFMSILIPFIPTGSVFTYIIMIMTIILIVVLLILIILLVCVVIKKRKLINNFFEKEENRKCINFCKTFDNNPIHKEGIKEKWMTYAKGTLGMGEEEAQIEWEQNYNKKS